MKAPPPSLLLLTGWPACGEAFYADWLERNRDFRHLDLNGDNPGDAAALRRWEEFDESDASGFILGLRRQHPRWVLTHAAPVPRMKRLPALRACGFELWFLLPRTEPLSRIQWLSEQRDSDSGVKSSDWAKRAEAIRAAGRELRPHFRDRCIETLLGSDELLSGDEFAVRVGLGNLATP